MTVKYEDYYKTLEVARTASQDEIQQAYRRLARKYHPDINKEKGAEARFKRIGEAYEVLKDPEKRSKYDALGENWKSGQEFRPPPGWEGFRGGGGGRQGGNVHVDFGGAGGFSDFFESIFGGMGGGGMSGSSPFGSARSHTRKPRRQPGEDVEAEITIPLADAFRGGTRHINLQFQQPDENGSLTPVTKSYDVKIPAGATDGTVIRLAGQGHESNSGGDAGDLLLKIKVAPDPRFEVHGHDLKTIVPISPSEAVLGTKVTVPLIDSEATVTIPPGSQSGQKLRLRGKGLPKRGAVKEHGDVLAELRIVVPKHPSPQEKGLYEELAKVSNFNPREA